jgi:hypothetical protein
MRVNQIDQSQWLNFNPPAAQQLGGRANVQKRALELHRSGAYGGVGDQSKVRQPIYWLPTQMLFGKDTRDQGSYSMRSSADALGARR